MAMPQKPPIYLLAEDDDRSCSFCGKCPAVDSSLLSDYCQDRVLKRRVFMEIWDDDMWFQCTRATCAILCTVCNFLVMSDRSLHYGVETGPYGPSFQAASTLEAELEPFSDSE